MGQSLINQGALVVAILCFLGYMALVVSREVRSDGGPRRTTVANSHPLLVGSVATIAVVGLLLFILRLGVLS